MKNKLLSLKQKRELLQRMARAVRKGRPLDAFCKRAGIDSATLSSLLHEMRALGTKGINPFLPDKTPFSNLTPVDKIRFAKKMEAYHAKTNIPVNRLCELAGVNPGSFYFWKRHLCHYQTNREDWKKSYGTPRVTSRVYVTPEEAKRRTRLVNAIIRAVNRGALLKTAVGQKMLSQTFYVWEKQYATVQRIRHPRHLLPLEERRRRTCLVNSVIMDLNKGMTYKEAFEKNGINGKKFNAWSKLYATVKRLWGAKKSDPRVPPQEIKRRKRLLVKITKDLNKGIHLQTALKNAGITENNFTFWRKKHGCPLKRLPRAKWKQNKEEVGRKKRLVLEVKKAMRRGMRMEDAVREAGIHFKNYYYWAKTLFPASKSKKIIRHPYNPLEKERIMRNIANTIIKKGGTIRDAASKEGISKSVFYMWKKEFSLPCLMRSKKTRLTPEAWEHKKSVVLNVMKTCKRGMKVKDALKNTGMTKQQYYYWLKKISLQADK